MMLPTRHFGEFNFVLDALGYRVATLIVTIVALVVKGREFDDECRVGMRPDFDDDCYVSARLVQDRLIDSLCSVCSLHDDGVP